LSAFIRIFKTLSRVLDNEIIPSDTKLTPYVSMPEISTVKTATAALKEWAIVCKALEDGRQLILLRKGGIIEYRQGFEVKHRTFLLYPTFEHQSKDLLQPDYANILDLALMQRASENGRNKITSFAVVVHVKELLDKAVIARLGKYHIWNDRYLAKRVSYNPGKPLTLLVLRVYNMSNPIVVVGRPELAGCKSWIPIELLLPDPESRGRDKGLGQEYSEYNNNNSNKNDQYVLAGKTMTTNCRPVLSDSKFKEITCELLEVLN
jgi:hypothetical protein